MPGRLAKYGFPASSTGKESLGNRLNTDSHIIFHRITNTLACLEIQMTPVGCVGCVR